MPVVRVDAGKAAPQSLWDATDAMTDAAPIVVMIHGYRYSPSRPSHDPHRHILSLSPDQSCRRALSWPRALGFGTGTADEGLAVAFGWEARGTLGGAYRRAEDTGRALANLVDRLSDRTGRPVALIGHSLGGRVALQSLRFAPAGSVGRVCLLTAAEFRDQAAQALDSPAGHRAEVLNITSRENDLFDFAMELWLGRGRRQALGFGLDHPARNWIDVQIDDGPTLDMLAQMGFPVERNPLRLSHWTPYLRGGLFDFYRTALKQPWALPMPVLRARLPGRIAPRWSRLLDGLPEQGLARG
ncbi:alpha/beta fold hydrolase [Paracoccus homiensis]|uniref:Uncharacterized protein n=1 Tax=Paracoccus homiensis TaxID=364199 RepID=A0A1I0IRY7_9RHOB|nr:alpha/beta fold hydrolase [Paracoccus homiensis]SEU00007.1 hypothetical protein SAMN04489858_11852 [Paracoccus homiensis]